ncbi:hypothetical protein SAMN04487866_11422 [Thermoactinomyces sp. DSM 45891]|uniref:helix-turn-helix domain-containing protein n=1 Tax=Thermoactinomyces sp. DSM 45891 TaxID=1761907 RepID=UPI00091F5E08|nr:hypothetical protein [Thermoactinomyces sp. DSM 45891]SFX62020.1 hypothetical protein SAMN04487866_11422 [Thermoactinomyces sp. DSM 45891]
MKTCEIDSTFIEENRKEIGMLIRKVREARKLRLKDWDDGKISTTTISNIERGTDQHTTDMIIYLLEKIGISTMEELSDMLEQERDITAQLNFQLKSAESFLKLGLYDKSIKTMEHIDITDSHPSAPLLHFQRGQCLKEMGKWECAEKSFFHVLELLSDQTEPDKSNIESASLNELAFCMHHHNKLDQALHFTETGIQSFTKGSNRQYLIFRLYLNKIVFLHKLNRTEGILTLLDEISSSLHKVTDTNVRLKYYWLRSHYTRKAGEFEEALHYAEQGLELAESNGSFNMILEFWLCIASALTSMGKFQEAEKGLLLAIEFPSDLVESKSMASAHLKLGILYSQQQLWNKAEPYSRTAREMSFSLNDAPMLFSALILSGDVSLNQSDPINAVQFYENAQTLAHRYNYTELEIQAWSRLANYWKDVDQQKFYYCTSQFYCLQSTTSLKGDYYYDEIVV